MIEKNTHPKPYDISPINWNNSLIVESNFDFGSLIPVITSAVQAGGTVAGSAINAQSAKNSANATQILADTQNKAAANLLELQAMINSDAAKQKQDSFLKYAIYAFLALIIIVVLIITIYRKKG